MTTSNVYNTGIMHWAPTRGGRAACGHRRAIMATTGELFEDETYKCKRCETKWNAAKERSAKKVIGTIDMTPTWVGVLPVYLAALQDGTPQAMKAARDELYRMARIADSVTAK
jgi:hypothetical protein